MSVASIFFVVLSFLDFSRALVQLSSPPKDKATSTRTAEAATTLFARSSVTGPRKSLFGYSVALHHDGSSQSVLVGAPADNDPTRSVRVSGSLFQCFLVRNHLSSCSRLALDSTGNTFHYGSPVEEKAGQWFGAAVATIAGKEGWIMACAPRYAFFSSPNRTRDPDRDRDPVGTCILATGRGFAQVEESSPCRIAQRGFQGQGFCQFGFSAASYNTTFLVGAVGNKGWQGQVYSRESDNGGGMTRETPHWIRTSSSGGGGGGGDNVGGSSDSDDHNQYLGYAVSGGSFFTDFDIAVSAPRASNLLGKVHLLSASDSRLLYSFSGEQVGSYFGHSLASADFDGDGGDDLAVGAPLFGEGGIRSFEEGRVYVIIRSKRGLFKTWRLLRGLGQAGARFGFSLAAIKGGGLGGGGPSSGLCVSAPGANAVAVYYQLLRSSAGGPDVVLKPAERRNWPSGRGGLFGFSVAALATAANESLVAVGEPVQQSLYLFVV